MSQGELPDGATVWIFLGSKSNHSEDTSNIFSTILEKNVVLHTFGFVFDDIYRLSVKTGGKAVLFANVRNEPEMELEAVLTESVYSDLPEWQQPVMVSKKNFIYNCIEGVGNKRLEAVWLKGIVQWGMPD